VNSEAKRLANIRWRRRNRDQVVESCRTYDRKHREQRRQKSRERLDRIRAENPAFVRDRARAFRARHPNYRAEQYQRHKLRDAWLKFSTVCAANRREREVSP
jgi:hypothetical protein